MGIFMVSVCRLAPRRPGLLDLAFARASACYTWAEEEFKIIAQRHPRQNKQLPSKHVSVPRVIMPATRHNASLPFVRGYAPYQLTAPHRPRQGTDYTEGMPWACGVPSGYGVEGGYHGGMQGMLSTTVAHEERQGADATIGCCDSSNDDAWVAEAPGYSDENQNQYGIAEQWECLLANLRSTRNPTPTTSGGESECLVGVQPPDRVFRPEAHREAVTSLWVVNPMDWIDVEYVLRRMLRCESIECHAFHTMGYIFFRSSALAHVTAPSHYLQPGTTHRFADTCIAVEITQAHAEGVLEVACFVEYLPQ